MSVDISATTKSELKYLKFFSNNAAITNHILFWMRRLRTTFDLPVIVNITIIYFPSFWSTERIFASLIIMPSAGSVHAWNTGIVRSAYRPYGIRTSLNDDRWLSLDTKTQRWYHQNFFSSDSNVEWCTTMHSERPLYRYILRVRLHEIV